MKEKSLKLNATLNIIKQFMNLIFPLITFPYSSRILNPEGIGKVNFALSIVSYFAMFASLGIGKYATREAAKVRDDRFLLSKFAKEILTINFSTTFLSYLLFFIAVFTVPQFSSIKVLLCICSSTILFSTLGVEWIYNAKEEYVYITVRGMVFQVISLILLFVLVHKPEDFMQYAAINVISSVGSNILNFINLRRFIDFKLKIKKELKKHFKPILILFGATIAISLYNELDKTMIGFLSSEKQVGFYSASTKISKLVISIITAILTVISPRLSNYAEHNKEKYNELLKTTFNVILMLCLPFFAGLILMAKPLTLLFCGENFLPSVIIMQVMAFIIVDIPLATFIHTQIFIPLRKDVYTFYSVLTGCIINALCNVFLILKFKALGAGIATVIAETSVTIISFIFVRKAGIKLLPLFKNAYQYISATTLMGLAIILLKNFMNNNLLCLFIEILTGIIIYFITLLLMKNKIVYSFYISFIGRLKKNI